MWGHFPTKTSYCTYSTKICKIFVKNKFLPKKDYRKMIIFSGILPVHP